MGLDMFMYARKTKYESAWSNGQGTNVVAYPPELDAFDVDNKDRSISVTESYQIGYWRKANAIHSWIVTNCANGVDECQTIELSLDDLKALQVACLTVLADHASASTELPTGSGFFFGSPDYDDWYFNQVQYTLGVVRKAIKFLEADESVGWSIEYQASW